MLSQFILSLTKGSFAVRVLLHFIIRFMYVIPPFALMQKVEPKDQGKPEPLRASCRPRATAVFTAFISLLLRSKMHVPVLNTTFSKPHAFPFKCNRLQAPYSASLFLQ
jgi:hypothetical protein